MSGRRGSNSPPIAWKAIALPNELLPLVSFFLFNFQLWKELLMRIELTTFPIYDRDATSELQLSKTELLMRIELTTSSLPRKCSTPELQQLVDKNCPWAIPNIREKKSNQSISKNSFCGQSRVRTYVLVREQIYSLSPLTTRPSAQLKLQLLDLQSLNHWGR